MAAASPGLTGDGVGRLDIQPWGMETAWGHSIVAVSDVAGESRRALATLRGRLARSLTNALLPPRCLRCRVPLAREDGLCHDCWEDVEFIGAPHCAACGLPFAYDLGTGVLCAACVAERPAFDRARAVFRYDDGSRKLLLDYKHGDRTEGAPVFASWMARAGRELLSEANLIAPVPLHPRRLFKRRYNQSALLAAALARASGAPYAPDLLIRRRHTPPQGRLSRAARRRNIAGAIAVASPWLGRVPGQRVLLVDDVMTTGVTADICARSLLRAGAAAADVLVLARVVRTES
jgi:ComF family protein